MKIIDIAYLTLVIIIFITLIRILLILNKKEKDKLQTELEKIKIYEDSLEEIDNSQGGIDAIDLLSRGFFKEWYGLGYNYTYLELAKIFEKKERRDIAEFCQKMSDLLYSGNDIKKSEFNEVKKLLKDIIKKG